jgi:hypothetical protein
VKVYVVLVGKFVSLVTADRAEAETHAKDRALSYTDSVESRFQPERGTEHWDIPREELFYRSGKTGRWNGSRWFISTADLNAPELDRKGPTGNART